MNPTSPSGRSSRKAVIATSCERSSFPYPMRIPHWGLINTNAKNIPQKKASFSTSCFRGILMKTTFSALLLMAISALYTSSAKANDVGRVVECNSCPSTVNAAISKGNGLTAVVDFDNATLTAYEVEYDRERRRWRATRVPVPGPIDNRCIFEGHGRNNQKCACWQPTAQSRHPCQGTGQFPTMHTGSSFLTVDATADVTAAAVTFPPALTHFAVAPPRCWLRKPSRRA